MRRWSLKLICSWCTTPTFDYIHTSLSNSSGATELQLLLNYWETVSCELWQERDETFPVMSCEKHQTGAFHLPPTTWQSPLLLSSSIPSLTLDTNKARVKSRLMNSTWWQVWGLRPRQNTPTGTGISCCWRVKIFVIIESCDNLTNSKYWSSTYIQS